MTENKVPMEIINLLYSIRTAYVTPPPIFMVNISSTILPARTHHHVCRVLVVCSVRGCATAQNSVPLSSVAPGQLSGGPPSMSVYLCRVCRCHWPVIVQLYRFRSQLERILMSSVSCSRPSGTLGILTFRCFVRMGSGEVNKAFVGGCPKHGGRAGIRWKRTHDREPLNPVQRI